MSSDVKSTEVNQQAHKDENIPDEEKYIAEGGSTGGSEEGDAVQKENNKNNSSNPLEGNSSNQSAAKQIDLISKLIGVENLKNSMIQDSPQNASSNNSSIAEQTPNNLLLNDYLEGIKHVQEVTNDPRHMPTKAAGQDVSDQANNDKQIENQNNNGLTQKGDNVGRKGAEVSESVVNILIRKDCKEENLGENHINISKDEHGIEGQNTQTLNDKQSHQEQNGKNSDDSHNQNLISMFNHQAPDLLLFRQDLSNSPNIQNLSTFENRNDSTPQSLCLDTQERETIQRSTSYHQTSGSIPISQGINNTNLLSVSQQMNDGPSPSVSQFAMISKQQSRRDMKMLVGKSFIGGQRGSGNLANSSILPNTGQNSSTNSMSSFILQKKISMSSQQGGLGDSRDMQSLDDSMTHNQTIEQLSESVPACAIPKKTISLLGQVQGKKSIKITNTTSTELKKYNFQDDDIINFDQKAYQNLAQSYNINQNIGISIKTQLNYQISSTTQKNTLSVTQVAANIASSPSKQVSINLNTYPLEEKRSLSSQQSESFKTNNNNSSNSLDNVSHTSSSSHKGGMGDNKSTSNDKDDQLELEKSGLLDTPPKFEQITTKKVVIPVLLSVKTEEQMLSFQYIEQLEQNSSEKDIHSLHQIENQQQDSNKNSPTKLEGDKPQRLSIDNIHIEHSVMDEVKELAEEQGNKADSSSCQSESDNPLNSEDLIDLNHKQGGSNKQILGDNVNDDDPDYQEPEPTRKISQKNILMKSIKTKAKNTKDKLLKQIKEETKEEMKKSSPLKTHSSTLFQGLSNPFQTQPMRFPIDLICVIDTSGSMNGEPLDLLKETLLFLVDLLQTGDRICLIQFSTNAKRLTPLLSIESKDNVETIKGEINRLLAKGGTNISQGMQLAFDVLKQRRYKNPITSVFLLSDGLNDGAENRIRDLLKQLNFYQNYNEENFTIQTFGFGKDHDPNLMDKISQLMDGNFYYIGDIHRIDECFIDALGGLFSVISQNVAIKVCVPHEMRNKIRIVKTYGDIWHVIEPYYEYVININQLLCGVSKDYILEIELDSKIIDDSQCIQEIHSEEEIQSSEQIGSNRNFDTTQKSQSNQNVYQFPNILEAQLKAKNISININHSSSSKFPNMLDINQDSIQKRKSSQNEYQPSAPDLIVKDSMALQQIYNEQRGSVMSAVLAVTSGQDLSNEKSISNQLQVHNLSARQPSVAPFTTPSQSECSQLSINVIPAISEDPFVSVTNTKKTGGQEKEVQESNSDYIIKKDILNLKNHKQIQENLVKLHYLRVKGAEGLEKCQSLALQKKFDEGNEYVSKLLSELNEQPEETRRNLQKLILDLTEAQDTLRKKVGEQIGWHRMISCKRMHMEQRSAGTDLTYQNSVQKIMVQRRKSIKDQNSIQSLTETVTKMQHQLGLGLFNSQSQEERDKIGNKTLTSSDSSDSDSDSSSCDESTPKNKQQQNVIRKKKSHTVNPSLYSEMGQQNNYEDEINEQEQLSNNNDSSKNDESKKTEEVIS